MSASPLSQNFGLHRNGAEALRRAGKGGAPLREAIARNADRHAQNWRWWSRIPARLALGVVGVFWRALEGDWPYLWIDATYLKVRQNGAERSDHRETAETYAGELFRLGRYRVAVCRDGIQWLFQRQRPRFPAGGAAWDTLGYCADPREPDAAPPGAYRPRCAGDCGPARTH